MKAKPDVDPNRHARVVRVFLLLARARPIVPIGVRVYVVRCEDARAPEAAQEIRGDVARRERALDKAAQEALPFL